MAASTTITQDVLDLTLNGLRTSIQQHMPSSAYRDFYLWALSSENPHRQTFLEVNGIVQLVKLTITLLDDLVDSQDWPQLAEASILMNTYQIYEIVSDNLAIGLGYPDPNDTSRSARGKLLHAFNNAMIKRLNGNTQPAANLLEPYQPYAKSVSSLDQSLSRDKHWTSIRAYLKQHKNRVDARNLQYSTWPVLVANVESALDLVSTMYSLDEGELLHDGLTFRYCAVNSLLENHQQTADESAEVGAWAILVVPTLAYYVLVLGAISQRQHRLGRVIADGEMLDALYNAALLVRLLNDLGGLVVMSPSEREGLIETLAMRYWQSGQASDTIRTLLTDAADVFTVLTRVQKDIVHGEFNVALNNLQGVDDVPEALARFGDNLDYFSRLYAERYQHLDATLQRIAAQLGDKRISTLIARFVRFHEHLYSYSYRSANGEYAI